MDSFGKRNPPAANNAFREKAITFAHRMGLKTGGPDGLFPSKGDYKELVARAHADLKRRTKEVHDILAPMVGPDCQMIPFFLIPESCWAGETGQYLVEFLRLTPYGAWNTAFLPGNAWTAAIVGTTLHPRAEAEDFTATIKKLILDSKSETGIATEKARKTGDLKLVTAARNRSIALILTAAKKVASHLAEIGKPDGPDHRAGLSFLSLKCIDFQRG
jgi:hypothetical protein